MSNKYWTDKTDKEDIISAEDFNNAFDNIASDMDENKADKATTLSGYGITDAYTKAEIDESIGDIETALLEIEAVADRLIGGDAE